MAPRRRSGIWSTERCRRTSRSTRRLAVARRVAAGPTHAFRLSKRITHRITDAALSFDAVFATEADAQGEATRTADYTEGITAFQTKREPSFTGRPASVRHSSLRIRYPQYDHLAL